MNGNLLFDVPAYLLLQQRGRGWAPPRHSSRPIRRRQIPARARFPATFSTKISAPGPSALSAPSASIKASTLLSGTCVGGPSSDSFKSALPRYPTAVRPHDDQRRLAGVTERGRTQRAAKNRSNPACAGGPAGRRRRHRRAKSGLRPPVFRRLIAWWESVGMALRVGAGRILL